jgi:CRISPR-associated protein Cas1
MLRARKNHYNIKLRKGYRVSISVKENRVCLRWQRSFHGNPRKRGRFVSQIPYEKIVISGKGAIN